MFVPCTGFANRRLNDIVSASRPNPYTFSPHHSPAIRHSTSWSNSPACELNDPTYTIERPRQLTSVRVNTICDSLAATQQHQNFQGPSNRVLLQNPIVFEHVEVGFPDRRAHRRPGEGVAVGKALVAL